MTVSQRGRVSVIIPTYERTCYLEEALRSVLAQSWPVHQILLIDDGSRPEKRREAERLAGISDRIDFQPLPAHRGAAAARNRGLDLATGDYVLFLDDDDLLAPSMIERSVSQLEANPDVDAVVCDSQVICMPDGGPAFRIPPSPARAIERNPFGAILRRGFPIHSCLIRRASVESFRFPEQLAFGEDIYFWLALCRHGRRFTAREEADAIVRRHALNTTRSRATMRREARALYHRLFADDMVVGKEERVVIQLKLAYCEIMSGRATGLSHLASAVRHPWISLRETARFGARVFGDPRGFARHYFMS